MDNNQNHIEEIFRDAFANHESEVGSHVWANVQAGIAAQGAAASGAAAVTTMMKAAAVVGISALTVVGTVNEIQLQTNQGETNMVEVEESNNRNEEPAAATYTAVETSKHEQELESEAPSKADQSPSEQVAVITNEPNDTPPLELTKKVNSPHPAQRTITTESNSDMNANRAAEQSSSIESTEESKPEAAQDKEAYAVVDEETKDDKSNTESPDEEEVRAPKVRLTHDAKAFISPDGDGTNDCFTVGGGEELQSFSIKIYTQAGEQVFESGDIGFSWCGTDKHGKLLENRTTCFYLIQAIDKNGELYNERNAKGSIMIFH